MTERVTAAAFRSAFHRAGDAEPLALPDGEVVGSSADDAIAVLAALRATAWPRNESVADGDALPTVRVWPAPDVQVDCFLGWGPPVTFDLDLRQIVDDDALAALLGLVRLVCSTTGKDVVVCPEGERGVEVVRVSAQDGRVTLSPLGPVSSRRAR
ncbi:hypothetical protein ACTJKO_14710 [Curtobacterium sp. 22159]|uniref:hypothetical protein n=1 Tax=Curtobacterium sp. 22159 TaxID=3453882 RepID=UPI003F84E2CE